MRAAQLELEGTPPPVLRKQLYHARQGQHAAESDLATAEMVVEASRNRLKSWNTSIAALQAALRQLGECGC